MHCTYDLVVSLRPALEWMPDGKLMFRCTRKSQLHRKLWDLIYLHNMCIQICRSARVAQLICSSPSYDRFADFPHTYGKLLSICPHLYVGIAQIEIPPPPPALKRALWGTFFQARFSHFKGLYASGVPVLLAVSSSLVCE